MSCFQKNKNKQTKKKTLQYTFFLMLTKYIFSTKMLESKLCWGDQGFQPSWISFAVRCLYILTNNYFCSFNWDLQYKIKISWHGFFFISVLVSALLPASALILWARADSGYSDWDQNNHNLHGLSLCFLFVLRFYGPVNPMGSCWAQSVYLTTLLLGRLSPLSG